jgi:hypothetical protein
MPLVANRKSVHKQPLSHSRGVLETRFDDAQFVIMVSHASFLDRVEKPTLGMDRSRAREIQSLVNSAARAKRPSPMGSR